MLAVVKNEQRVHRLERTGDNIARLAFSHELNVERPGDSRNYVGATPQRRKFDEPRAIAKPIEKTSRDPERGACLADAPGTRVYWNVA